MSRLRETSQDRLDAIKDEEFTSTRGRESIKSFKVPNGKCDRGLSPTGAIAIASQLGISRPDVRTVLC